ncbi:MAG: heavy-metal-associated domain-containing protein [Planctomycetes bacterium]|nr:heavy-metal-associated domain-containing protein [Planctomycetota bacterium]
MKVDPVNIVRRSAGRVAGVGRHCTLLLLGWACVWLGPGPVVAQDAPVPQRFKHQIVGLFCPEREEHLREAFALLPKMRLLAIDYEQAEVTVEYDPAQLWPGEKPARFTELFSNEIANVSRHTFRAKPLRTKPVDQLKRVQIRVAGLDCLGCSYGAYRLIYELPGVELATADFKQGLVTALIDPEKTDQAKLEAALHKGGVEVPGVTPPVP